MSRSKNNEKKNNGAVEMEDVNLSTMYLSMISAFPMVMRAAIELDLLEIRSKAGPNAQLSPLQIASKLPTQNHPTETSMMLDRMLRLLASHSVLTCTTIICENGLIERLYGLAPLSKYFVQDKDGISFCPFLILGLDKVFAESWVKNYLEDQLLGFALVPLSDLFIENGKLAQKFSAFDKRSFSFSFRVCLIVNFLLWSSTRGHGYSYSSCVFECEHCIVMQDFEIMDSVPNDYEKIEFLDPNVVNENHLMVSQYYGLDSQNSESLLNSDSDDHYNSSAGVHVVKSFSEGSLNSTEVT
ncbi:hypothetical protein IFM89_003665 [Coptis chinensis]|uniref:O-methyltransferase dimerisation domain-containing protein n=1 Tax=Coptis chinensis TaxID=261450 RepID=A0A835HNH6_9MAGN|nr:hypothetical protein IFM89_003665 [Coptis chinensis]